MTRLIDADKLMEGLDNIVYTRKSSDRHLLQIVSAIQNAPTVDAVEVVHAEWKESISLDEGFWICSNCNFVSEATAAPILYKYCPNCGAKMDGERRDNV